MHEKYFLRFKNAGRVLKKARAFSFIQNEFYHIMNSETLSQSGSIFETEVNLLSGRFRTRAVIAGHIVGRRILMKIHIAF